MDLQNQVFVVTGANRGIGLEFTRELLIQGAQVVAGIRKGKLNPEIEELMQQHPGRLTVLDLDVQSDASVAKFSAEVPHQKIDVLINNAAIFIDDEATAMDVSPARVLETLNTNSVGPVRVTQALLPLLKKASLPKVAHITSQMGSISDNTSGGAAAYRMSKAALNMYSKTLAIDEKNLISLVLHPGWVKTDMGGPQAPMRAHDSAKSLIKVIAEASLADSGKFLNFKGREIKW